jgi:hypothetical protein
VIIPANTRLKNSQSLGDRLERKGLTAWQAVSDPGDGNAGTKSARVRNGAIKYAINQNEKVGLDEGHGAIIQLFCGQDLER